MACLATWGTPGWSAQVWYEYGLGYVTVGFDKSANDYVHRKFYLAALGPEELPAKACLEAATSEAADPLRKALRELPELPADIVEESKPGVAPATAVKNAKELLAARDKAVDQLVSGALTTFRAKLGSLPVCSSLASSASQFKLGLVQRICDAKAACKNVGLTHADDEHARSFHALRTWIDLRDTANAVLPANAPVLLLEPSATPDSLQLLAQKDIKRALAECQKAVVQALPGAKTPTCLGLALADQLKEANPWPAPPDKETMQKQFEQLVIKAREGQNQLHKDVVRVMDIPYEVATRVLDVLADPAQALEGLRLDPKANLLIIQDELARTRIGECVRFQGISRMDLVSQCAGFVVDVKTVGLCLAGQECRPALSTNGKASAAALTLLRPIRVKDLAQANLLPRIGVNPEKFAEVFDSCAKNQSSREAAANCVLEKQLSEQQKKALQCVQKPTPGQTLVDRVSCATGEQLPADVKQSVECLQSGTGDQRIRCVAKAQMPKEMKVYAECKEEASGDDANLAQCVAKKKLQMPKEMQAYVECKEKAGNDNNQLIQCVGKAMGKALPGAVTQCLDAAKDKGWEAGAMCVASQQSKEVAQAWDCAQKAGGDESKFLGCMAAKNIPPKHQRAATCLAQSANATGAALCMAAGSSKLNEDQRIVAECLATSPDGAGTLACIGGRMALQTFMKCVDKKIFEGNCFGKNNEIVKAFNALGIRLHPKSGIGRVANAFWDTVKFQVAAAKAIGKGIEHFGEEAKEELAKAERSLKYTGYKVDREQRRWRRQADTNFSNGVDWLSKRTGIKLKW